MNRVTKDTMSADLTVSMMVGKAIRFSYMYYKTRSYHISTARTVRRIDSVTRSPLFSLFTENLNGVVTVRANSADVRFTSELNSASYNMAAAQ
ncbi:hypothetical protein BJ742DRAFT_778037 [Cladochytrium replicatum]|nr:hypothetical protein BJ742DRAFT_778037 [Cladochytrium replicatum]